MRTLLAYRLSLPLLLVILMAGLLAACGGDDATEAPAPAATTAPASATSAPVATAAPTAAPSGPTNTPRPTPAPGQAIPTVAPTEAVAESSKTWPGAYPKAGENGIPADVGKFTAAMDSWGSSDLNPWAATQVNFLGDYYNLRLMMQDPNGVLKPAWALSFEQTLDGLTFQLNPDARFQDGTPADAEALKTNLLGGVVNLRISVS